MLWEGALKVFEGNDKLTVKFISSNGQIFAQLDVLNIFLKHKIKKNQIKGS